ncbi:hypothetical protein E2C01_048263 [Portunus trituberculatus]|uniref:Uncharacterized protein n=1 Tax=Portunus trituberculatus TaxID=210409 RepID=A0A5B7G5Y3_PORTR|nr:hypothetical protein [Portunus trituberculatus]
MILILPTTILLTSRRPLEFAPFKRTGSPLRLFWTCVSIDRVPQTSSPCLLHILNTEAANTHGRGEGLRREREEQKGQDVENYQRRGEEEGRKQRVVELGKQKLFHGYFTFGIDTMRCGGVVTCPWRDMTYEDYGARMPYSFSSHYLASSLPKDALAAPYTSRDRT